jgi:nucleoid DNA-binding protein
MAQNKTVENDDSVDEFLNKIENEIKKQDCIELDKIISKITGEPAKMWGSAIVGYGTYHYKYDSGREGDFMRSGFSPRKQNLTIYVINGFDDYREDLKLLGKHKSSKSCLYINKLADIDLLVLKRIIKKSVATMKKRYPQEGDKKSQ